MPGVLCHDALVFPRSLFLTYKLNKSRISVRFFFPRCMQTQGTGARRLATIHITKLIQTKDCHSREKRLLKKNWPRPVILICTQPRYSLHHIVTRDVCDTNPQTNTEALSQLISDCTVFDHVFTESRAGRRVPLPWRLRAAFCGPRRERRESARVGVNVAGSY